MSKAKKREHSNNKKTGKIHFNVIDAVIIILVVASVLGIYFRYNVEDIFSKSKETCDYTVSFAVNDIRYTTPNYISVGDKVYFADTGNPFGELISESENKGALNIKPASKFFTDTSGKVVEAFYPNDESRVNAKGRLVCKGIYTDDGGFCVGGTRYIAPGQTVEVQTEYVTLLIRITAIEEYTAE